MSTASGNAASEMVRLLDENRRLRELVSVLAPRAGIHEFPTYPDYMEWTYLKPRELGIDV